MVGPTGEDTAELRRRTLLEMEQLLEAAQTLREDLDGHVAVCQEVADGVRRGEPLAAVLERVDSRSWRPKMTDALGDYEKLRKRARLRLIALGAAEGMTVTDIEHQWSITRQLANRSMREAEHLD